MRLLDCQRVGVPNPHVVQGSTVLLLKYSNKYTKSILNIEMLKTTEMSVGVDDYKQIMVPAYKQD